MKLTILGSSGGYPEPGRACSGYLWQWDTSNVWIDAGTGTLDALMRVLGLGHLDAIFLSHLHPDHWTDLPIALHRIAVTRTRGDLPPLPVYGPPEWPEQTGIASQWYSRGDPNYNPITLRDGDTHRIGGCEFTFAEVQHGMPTFALRITDGQKTLAYSADTSPCAALLEIARGADLFLCEATLPSGRETPISMNPEQAGEVARSAGVRRLVLTHLLPGIDTEESCRAAASVFGGPVDYARQGAVFEVGSRG